MNIPDNRRALLTGALFLLVGLFFGCGPFYRTVVMMTPVNTGDYTVDPDLGVCETEKAGVKVTLSFEKRKELETAAQYFDWNPYLSEQKVFYSVFKLKIENTRQEKILADMSKAVLLDGLAGQENALTLDYFKSVYPVSTKIQQQRGIRRNEYPEIIVYTEDYYRYLAVERTIFKNQEIHPGVKMEGYVVFNQVRQEAGNITVVLPGIKLLNAKNTELDNTGDLRFKFTHSVSVKEINANNKAMDNK